MEIHTWAQNDIAAVLLSLVTDSLTYMAYKFCIPSRSQTGSDGESCGIVGFVSPLTCRVYTYTSRTISENGGRNAKTGDGW